MRVHQPARADRPDRAGVPAIINGEKTVHLVTDIVFEDQVRARQPGMRPPLPRPVGDLNHHRAAVQVLRVLRGQPRERRDAGLEEVVGRRPERDRGGGREGQVRGRGGGRLGGREDAGQEIGNLRGLAGVGRAEVGVRLRRADRGAGCEKEQDDQKDAFAHKVIVSFPRWQNNNSADFQ